MSKITGRVFDIQRFAVHDGPGIRTLVFMKGCPLYCKWCSNPESQNFNIELSFDCSKCVNCNKCIDKCPYHCIRQIEGKKDFNRQKCNNCSLLKCIDVCNTKAITKWGWDTTVEELMEEIDKDELFYKNSEGGVTVSGGEPLSQAEFVSNLLKVCKNKNYHTAIETSSAVNWDAFAKVIPYTDLFLCDIKHTNSQKLLEYTGGNKDLIFKNLTRLSSTGKDIIGRIPVIPGFNDNKETIMDISKYMQKINIKEVHLLNFHNYGKTKYEKLNRKYSYCNVKPIKNNTINQFKNIVSSFGLNVKIGG